MVLTSRSYEIEIIIMYSQYCLENTTFIGTYIAIHVVCIYLLFGIVLQNFQVDKWNVGNNNYVVIDSYIYVIYVATPYIVHK